MRRFIQDKGRTSAPQVWEVAVKGHRVVLTWGQQGGSMQSTTQEFTALNVGKANEKSPDQVADEWADRQALLRTRKGYVEVDLKTNEPLVAASASTIDFTRLPENLRFFKPQNSMNAHCTKLVESGDAVLLRKRNGMMHVLATDEYGYTRMYSSTMAPSHKDEPNTPWLERYPHLEKEIASLQLPSGTILLGELVTPTHASFGFVDEHGFAIDSLEYVGSIAKSLTPRALEMQRDKGELGFCIWDIAFWDDACLLQTTPAKTRFGKLFELINHVGLVHLTVPEHVILMNDRGFDIVNRSAVLAYESDPSADNIIAVIRDLKWEGLVVVDGESTYDDRAYNFHGKPERPKSICKWKPKLEADFIVRWDPDNGIGKWGKGKKKTGVGSVVAYLWDPETQQEVQVSDVGGGLTDDNVAKFADPSLYPMVWQVEFASWTAKGSLQFPEFIRVRDDKTPEECTLDQRPPLEAAGEDA